MDRKSTTFSLHVYKQKSFRSSEQNPNCKSDSHNSSLIPRIEPAYRHRTSWIKGRFAPWGRNPWHYQQIILLIFLSLPPQQYLQLFTRICIHWEKGNKNLEGLLDTGSELTLIPEDPSVQTCGGKGINEVLIQLHMMMAPVFSFTQPVLISPVLQCLIGIDILSIGRPLE